MNSTSSLNLKLKASLILQSDLRNLTRQLLAKQDGQRQKLSMELNQLLSQQLATIDAQLNQLKAASKVNLRMLRVRIASMQRLLAKSVASVQQLAWEMHPSILDDLGLVPALTALQKVHAAKQGTLFKLSISSDIATATPAMRCVFYSIAKQALVGVAKNPRAHVALQNIAGGLCMTIRSTHKTPISVKRARLILLGMSERAQMVGGTVTSTTTFGKPTLLRIEIPFPPASAIVNQ